MMNQSTNSLFEGQLVRLRAIEPEDAIYLHQSRLDDEITRLDARIQWPESLAAVRRRVEKEDGERSDNVELLIETKHGQVVGGVSTQLADIRSGTFSIGIGLSEREVWGKGFAKEAMLLVLRFMFHEKRYQKCNIGVYAYNGRAIGFYRHLGFVDEGRLRRNHFTNGEYHDELLLGMTREEFDQKYPEWLLAEPSDEQTPPPHGD